MARTKFSYISEYLGIAEHILKNFDTAIKRNNINQDSLEIIDHIEFLMDLEGSDYTAAMRSVYDYLLNLGVKDCVRKQKGSGYTFHTAMQFAEKYTPYFTGEATSGKDGEVAIDLDSLEFPIGYEHTPLTKYEQQIKERRRPDMNYNEPNIYKVHVSKGY